FVAQPQPAADFADARADAGARVVVAPGLRFGTRGEDQAVGEQPLVLRLQPQAELAALAEVAGGLDMEPLRREPLESDGQVGPRGIRSGVQAQAADEVPPGRDRLPVEQLGAVPDLRPAGVLALVTQPE